MALSLTAQQTHTSIKLITAALTSDAAGDVTGSSTVYVDGEILSVEIVPVTGGSAPSAGWDLTIVDVRDVDILQGQGANLSGTANTIVSNCPPVASSLLTFTGSNMGNAKVARVHVMWR